MSDHTQWMGVAELAALIRSRGASAISVTNDAISRLESLDPALHSFCTPTIDLARERAVEIHSKITSGIAVGPLAGVPFGVKDLISTKGIRTTSGSVVYKDFIPDGDDVVVERSLDAGSVILGKTNSSEFGYSATGQNPLFPTTRNPWNINLTPGGSSAGSAAAVAAGIVPWALGSDGGGSVRIPAALTSLVGFKPSMGRNPVYPGCRDERFPGMSGWESIEHIGPLARSVADVALLMNVLAGPDPRDRHSIPAGDVDWLSGGELTSVTGLRVAYSADLGYLPVDPEVRCIVDAAVLLMEQQLGCTVTAAEPGWADPGDAFGALIMNDTDLVGLRAMVAQHGEHMSPHLVAMLTTPWSAEDFTEALMMRKSVVNAMSRFMCNYDVLVTPTTGVAAFELGIEGPTVIDGRAVSDVAWSGFTSPANLTGQPAISIPAGFTSDGRPVGMQIIGPHLGDAIVLRLSKAFEDARGPLRTATV